jgi:hypothetical protein
MLAVTKWTLIAEVNNEDDGGVTPSTLASALDSVEQGYNPDPDEGVTPPFVTDEMMDAVAKELEALIAEHGENCPLETLLTDADWNAHNDGSLQDLARDGK